MISSFTLTEVMIMAMKATLIFYSIFVFFLFGKFEKIPYSARQAIFVIGNSGCLFLAGGLITGNSYLIKGGLFILLIHALIDAHFLIDKYQMYKKIEDEKKETDAKK